MIAFETPHVRAHHGAALDVLRTMDAGSVHTCVTSPPYWGLRSYDENTVMLDPTLDDETREWVLAELERRGIHAKR